MAGKEIGRMCWPDVNCAARERTACGRRVERSVDARRASAKGRVHRQPVVVAALTLLLGVIPEAVALVAPALVSDRLIPRRSGTRRRAVARRRVVARLGPAGKAGRP